MKLTRQGRDALRFIAKTLVSSGTKPYQATATVISTNGTTATIRIDGADTTTPATLGVDVKPGDRVQVRVANSGVVVQGNNTAPPTDDAEAIAAKVRASLAKEAADTAQETADAAAEAASDAAKTATNYITEIGTGGIDVTAEDASSSIQIADTIRVKANDTNYSVQSSSGFGVYKDSERVAQFGETVTIGRESELHAVIEPDATRYIDAEGTTVIKLDSTTFDRRITGTDGTVAYGRSGETVKASPSAEWWALNSTTGTDGLKLRLSMTNRPGVESVAESDWEASLTIGRWANDGFPGSLMLYVPDVLIDRYGTGNYLPVESIELDFDDEYPVGETVTGFAAEMEMPCVHVGDQWIRIAAGWGDLDEHGYRTINSFWINPYEYLSDSPDETGVEFISHMATSAYADVDGNPITDTYATKTEVSAKQDALTAGSNITISGTTISATDTTDYMELSNKPSVESVELSGDKTFPQLGIFIDADADPVEGAPASDDYALTTTEITSLWNAAG